MNWLQKYFGFNRRERNGMAVLLSIIVLILFVPFFHRLYIAYDNEEGQFDKEIISLARKYEANADTDRKQIGKAENAETTYFTFDPNKLSLEEGKRLGLTERQIRTIQNYVAKGGRFRKADDLKRIYTLSEEDFAKLELYIHIGETVGNRGQPARQPDAKAFQPGNAEYGKSREVAKSMEINGADSVQWTALKGIGPVFASRIVRYRERLGGFFAVEQLLEVYGMDSVRLAPLMPLLTVDEQLLAKIDINKADYATLRAHPYISNKQASLIVQYRNQHGNYRSVDDLLEIVVFDKDFLRKIAPYIHINED